MADGRDPQAADESKDNEGSGDSLIALFAERYCEEKRDTGPARIIPRPTPGARLHRGSLGAPAYPRHSADTSRHIGGESLSGVRMPADSNGVGGRELLAE